MPLLFSYGTLQFPDVQLATFGRELLGRQDRLQGYQPSLVRIDDPAVAQRLHRTHHDNVTETADMSSSVQGTAFEVTEAELAQADAFEAEFNYVRRLAPLASGNEAWVYLHGA